MVNIREIAKKANVSPGTVSRVLNNDPSLSCNEKTREKIHQICKELNYIPRKYKNKRKEKSVGIITAISRCFESNDSYYRQIRVELLNSLKKTNFYIDFMLFLPYLEQNWQRVKSVDCIIVIGCIEHSIHEQIHRLNSNLIIVDDYRCSEKYSCVSVNFYNEMKYMLDYVYELGHRNIAFITGKSTRLNIDNQHIADVKGDREQAYSDWMEEKKLTAYHQPFIEEDWYAQSGYQAASRLLLESKDLPSVIIAASDLLAMGALRRFSEDKIKIPEDLSICSFDDLEIASFLNPSLTTLKVDIKQIVYWTTQLCQEIIIQPDFVPTKIVLSGKLIFRESLQAFTG